VQSLCVSDVVWRLYFYEPGHVRGHICLNADWLATDVCLVQASAQQATREARYGAAMHANLKVSSQQIAQHSQNCFLLFFLLFFIVFYQRNVFFQKFHDIHP